MDTINRIINHDIEEFRKVFEQMSMQSKFEYHVIYAYVCSSAAVPNSRKFQFFKELDQYWDQLNIKLNDEDVTISDEILVQQKKKFDELLSSNREDILFYQYYKLQLICKLRPQEAHYFNLPRDEQ